MAQVPGGDNFLSIWHEFQHRHPDSTAEVDKNRFLRLVRELHEVLTTGELVAPGLYDCWVTWFDEYRRRRGHIEVNEVISAYPSWFLRLKERFHVDEGLPVLTKSRIATVATFAESNLRPESVTAPVQGIKRKINTEDNIDSEAKGTGKKQKKRG